LAQEHPGTTCVCIGDSESDIFELFAEPRVTNAHFLIRAFRERNVTDEDHVETKIHEAVYATPILATKTLSVRARPAAVSHAKGNRDKARTAREALMEIRKTTLHLQPPVHLLHSNIAFKNHDPVGVNVVLVSEASPPPCHQRNQRCWPEYRRCHQCNKRTKRRSNGCC
jgi:hypothetical protein